MLWQGLRGNPFELGEIRGGSTALPPLERINAMEAHIDKLYLRTEDK